MNDVTGCMCACMLGTDDIVNNFLRASNAVLDAGFTTWLINGLYDNWL